MAESNSTSSAHPRKPDAAFATMLKGMCTIDPAEARAELANAWWEDLSREDRFAIYGAMRRLEADRAARGG